MKRFDEFMTESLAAEVKSEPKTETAMQAKKLGLTYMGFGRYADRQGKLAYMVHKNRLIPYKGDQEVEKMFDKAHQAEWKDDGKKGPVDPKTGKPKEKPHQTLYKQATELEHVLRKRASADEKVVKQKIRETKKLHKELTNIYHPDMFDEDQSNAIKHYTDNGFEEINRYLYKGHDEGTDHFKGKDIEKYVEDIDSAFEDLQTPFDYSTYTGLSKRYKAEKLKAGDEYIFRGYLSSSIDYMTAIDSFSDIDGKNSSPVVLQIDLKKGQKSLYVDPLADVGGEFETLLPRGTKVRIKSGPHPIHNAAIQVGDTEDRIVSLFHCEVVEDS